MAQTAVDWLEQEIEKKLPFALGEIMIDLFKQAKQMEKEQMIKFANDYIDDDEELTADQYYTQAYGNNQNK